MSLLPADVQAFTFYLAVAALQPDGGNADSKGRFMRAEVEVHDLFTEALPLELQVLEKKACLTSPLTPRDPAHSIPIVRVRRTSEGGFELDNTFIPPAVALGAAAAFNDMLKELTSAMSAKIEALQRMHRKVTADTYEVTSGDMSSWWMLNIVSTANALLMRASRSPGHHPETLYQKLLGVAGALMTFSDKYKTDDLPPYRHGELTETFMQLDTLLRDLVETVIAARYFLITLVPDKNRSSFFHGKLDKERVSKDTQLCLAVTADIPALELVAVAPVRLKLGAPIDLDKIVGSALSGIPLTHMPQVPAAVPVRPNTSYFSISTRHVLFESAFKAGDLSVYAPAGFAGLHMEIIAFA